MKGSFQIRWWKWAPFQIFSQLVPIFKYWYKKVCHVSNLRRLFSRCCLKTCHNCSSIVGMQSTEATRVNYSAVFCFVMNRIFRNGASFRKRTCIVRYTLLKYFVTFAIFEISLESAWYTCALMDIFGWSGGVSTHVRTVPRWPAWFFSPRVST